MAAPTMGLLDTLRQAGASLRKLRLSLGPDSYFQYRRRRNYERKGADHARRDAQDSDDRKRRESARADEKAARERGYEERYAREAEGDAAADQSED
jgi:hypothetical protein